MNSRSPFQEMLAGSPLTRVMQRTAEMNKFEFDSSIKRLSDDEITQLGIRTSGSLRLGGVQSTLGYGCLLYLYRAATAVEGRAGLFENLLEYIGLSRSQAYRDIAAWKCFGSVLANEPELAKWFVAESLKVLSEERTLQAARDAALELARGGECITIKRAKALRRKHGVTSSKRGPESKEADAPAQPSKTKPEREAGAVWSFIGKCTRLVVEPAGPAAKTDVAALISDLEDAIADLRRRHGLTENPSASKGAA